MDRRAIPLIAFLASLFMAGGGQLYNRQPAKAVVFFLLFWVGLAKVGPFAYAIAVVGGIEALLVALAHQDDQ